jgi:hypothetical protein
MRYPAGTSSADVEPLGVNDLAIAAPLTRDDSFLLVDRLRDLRRQRSDGLLDEARYRHELGLLLERRRAQLPIPFEDRRA